MADKNVRQAGKKDSPFMNVMLIDTHTHQGIECKKGETITIRRRQLKKLQEWGKVK